MSHVAIMLTVAGFMTNAPVFCQTASLPPSPARNGPGRSALPLELFRIDLAPDGNRCADKIQEGHYAGALADCLMEIQKHPSNPGGYLNRSAAKIGLKDFDGAIADATIALRLGTADPTLRLVQSAYANRAYAMFSEGNFDDAIADCTKSIQMKSPDAFAYILRGQSRLARAERKGVADSAYHTDLDGAIADCTNAIKLSARLGVAYATRGDAEQLAGDTAGALRDHTKARSLGYY